MKHTQEKKSVSFIVVPSHGSKTHNIKLPIWLFRSFIALILLVFVFTGTAFYLSTQYATDLRAYNVMKEKNMADIEKEKAISQEIQELKEDINELIEQEVQIQTILGAKKSRRWKQNLYNRGKKKQAAINKKFKNLMAHENYETEAIPFLEGHIKTLKDSMASLEVRVQKIQERFAFTPSIWPVYGYIKSGYGYRRHPVNGKRRFHKGIDIPSWTGAPIKATADGHVSYAGWSGTFGNVVVLNHRYGFRTIYAHAAQLLVRKGESIKKGQVIAQVGSTGLSTGSHVHYEIVKWNRNVSPKGYLNLDMFSVSAAK